MESKPAIFWTVTGAGRLAVVATLFPFGIAYAQSWTITPRVSASEGYSSNVGLTAPAQSGWITDLAPGIRVDGNGDRLKAHLDYQRDALRYAGHGERNQDLNSLSSTAALEAVDKWLYVDASANIVQRSVGAFNAIPTDTVGGTTTRSETRTVQISPYARGQVSDIAAYLVRFNGIDSRSTDATLSNTRVNQWSGTLKNASAGAKIGWTVDGNTSNVHNDIIGDRDNTRLRGALVFEALENLHLSVSEGRERTNYATSNTQSLSTPGLGFDWTPSPRTKVAAQGERRFFGTGHSILVSHRTGFLEWRYTDVKDAALLPTLLSASSQGAIAELMSDLLASSIPDPVARAAAVRGRLDQNSTVSNQAAAGGIQTSRILVDHVQQASVAMIGARNTVTVTFLQRDQEAIGSAAGVVDSFSLSNSIRQRGGDLSWVHRLTPLTTLNAGYGRLQTTGLSTAGLDSNQKTQTVSLAYRIDPKAVVSFGLRATQFASTVNGNFHENAVVATIAKSF